MWGCQAFIVGRGRLSPFRAGKGAEREGQRSGGVCQESLLFCAGVWGQRRPQAPSMRVQRPRLWRQGPGDGASPQSVKRRVQRACSLAQGPGDGVSPQTGQGRVQRACSLAQGSGDGVNPQPPEAVEVLGSGVGGRSKEVGLKLGGVVAGVGKDEAGTKAQRRAGGGKGVSARGDVVNEVGLA